MSTLTCSFLTGANQTVVDGLNRLLRILHSKSRTLDVMALADHIQRSRIAIAEIGDCIVGMGVLVPEYLLSHTAVSLHNFVTLDVPERPEIQDQLIAFMLGHAKRQAFDFLDFRVNLNREEMLRIGEIIANQPGFKSRDCAIYRLHLK